LACYSALHDHLLHLAANHVIPRAWIAVATTWRETLLCTASVTKLLNAAVSGGGRDEKELHMLVVESLSCRFGAKLAVDNASFVIPPGSFVGVIGRSGAGKSTLLRMINRLAQPSAGRILFAGVDVTALRGRELRRWRAQAAMIFQQFNLAGRLDVLTNVLMGRLSEVPSWRSLLQLWPEKDRAIALSALEQFDIAALASQRADQLSGGQQQRVAIARALVQQPDIILADEPIASLDPRNTRIVMDALLHINKQLGITVMCNLHSLDLARSYCDRLIGMAAGRVVFDGVPAALTDGIARELYDLEANEVMGRAEAAGALASAA
jgi:phosphonate transport system ATP-binding protein